MTTSRRLALVLLAVLAALAPAGLDGSSIYLPHLRFRVLATPHFRIYYHQRGESVAREVAAIAETVRAELPGRLGLPPPALTHVVIADQDDSANGSAFPLPYNTIRLVATWPPQVDLIGNTRDWLRMVFVHEYAHILQMDQSRGWASVMRSVFGRSPVSYPNLSLPMWQIEGFATWVESRETGEGRLRAGDAATIVRERVSSVGPEPIDRYNGGLVDWPSGNGPYLYGGFFHQYLADRFGEEKLGELIRRQAGRLHYFTAGAYQNVFGTSLSSLWTDFQRSTSELAVATTEGEQPLLPRRLTELGFLVSSPRFAPDGSALFFSASNPHRFPAVMRLQLPRGGGPARTAGSNDAQHPPRDPRPTRVANQYAGEGLSVGDRAVFFDQLELEGNVALRGDLYAVVGEDTRQVTWGQRLLQPALAPGGSALVCVRIVDGGRRLAWFDVSYDEQGFPRLDERPGPNPGDHVGSPRWSPDGRRLALERRVPGGSSQLVVIQLTTGEAQVLVSSETGRVLTPAWTPDGGHIVFAGDLQNVRGARSPAPIQLYVVPASGGDPARLTALPGGATSPEVSPDGASLVYVGYTPEGYDLFHLPFAELAARSVPEGRTLAFAGESSRSPDSSTLPEAVEHSYSPLPTLLPQAWAPLADTADGTLRLGFATAGVDVLGRHAWGATAMWRLNGEQDGIETRRARPDWNAAYVYDRWRTPFFFSVSDDTDFLPLRDSGGERIASAERRERSLRAGVALPFVKVRQAQVLQAAFNYERQTFSYSGRTTPFARHAIEAAWEINSARRFGYSISPEEGAAIGVTTEQVRSAFGADGDAQAWTVQARKYTRLGWRHSVLAARAGAGTTGGDASVRRTFFLGGNSAAGSVVNFVSDSMLMLRGLEHRAYAGWHVLSGSVEYRFPVTRVERGWRTLPVFLRALHAAVFTDAGHAWDRDFSWKDFKTSAGAEVSAELVLGFGLPVTVSAGIAWARDGASGRGLGATPYARIGRAF